MKTTKTVDSFLRFVTNPLKFKLYLFFNLPMAFLAGLKVADVNANSASVIIPYKFLTKNPFKSVYFACLAMAAELSTGVLAMMAVYQSQKNVSMLVVNMQAEFIKKAKGKITFTCSSGIEINVAVQESIKSGNGTTVLAESIGKDESGEKVAIFKITWSFKAKS